MPIRQNSAIENVLGKPISNGLPQEKSLFNSPGSFAAFSEPNSSNSTFPEPASQTSQNSDWAAWGQPTQSPVVTQQMGGDLFGVADFGNFGNSPGNSPFGAWNSQPKNLKKFLAGFNFEARNSDELSFVEGRVIKISVTISKF